METTRNNPPLAVNQTVLTITGDNNGTGIPKEWSAMSLAEISETPARTTPWLIDGLVASGTGTLVSAHPHGMKSLAWLQACIEASLNRKVWGHFQTTNSTSTLFIETEDPEWLVNQRVLELRKGVSISAEEMAESGVRLACLGPFDLVGMALN